MEVEHAAGLLNGKEWMERKKSFPKKDERIWRDPK